MWLTCAGCSLATCSSVCRTLAAPAARRGTTLLHSPAEMRLRSVRGRSLVAYPHVPEHAGTRHLRNEALPPPGFVLQVALHFERPALSSWSRSPTPHTRPPPTRSPHGDSPPNIGVDAYCLESHWPHSPRPCTRPPPRVRPRLALSSSRYTDTGCPYPRSQVLAARDSAVVSCRRPSRLLRWSTACVSFWGDASCIAASRVVSPL